MLHVAEPRVDAEGARQLDHALRLVDRHDFRAELVRDAGSEVSSAAADLEHPPRTCL
jgi:hypothetical protein